MRENFRCFTSPTEQQKEFLCYSDAMGFDSSPEFYINRPSFNDFLIMYTVYGQLNCCQNRRKIVNEGEAVFLDLHVPHEYYFEKGIPTKIAWVTINGSPAVSPAQKYCRTLLCRLNSTFLISISKSFPFLSCQTARNLIFFCSQNTVTPF